MADYYGIDLLNKANIWTGKQTFLDVEIAGGTIGGAAINTITENLIGIQGKVGFGVGICPSAHLPLDFTGMPGHDQLGSDNYGNYVYKEGSVMIWVPKFYYRMHTWATNQITVATKAALCQITQVAHGYVNGDKIFITNVGGMTQLNNKFYTVTKVDDDKYTIGVDSSAYTTFTSLGDSTKGFGATFKFNETLVNYGKNSISIKGIDTFPTTAEANAAGYTLHRVFIDGGVEKLGFFRDKYKCSKVANGTGFTAASIKNGLPLSASADHNPFSDCTGGENSYYSALDLAHRRDGVNGEVNPNSIFFCSSQYMRSAIAMLSMAHGQAATGTANCAWFLADKNYPKGCNNNALADCDDTTVKWESDGYSNCGKTGSAGYGGGAGNEFAKSTHNGQNCGSADDNGLMYEVSIGITCIATTKDIEAISQANPCQITITGHGLANGDMMQIGTAIEQTDWVGLNNKVWPITKIDNNNFTVAFDSSGFATAYNAVTDPGKCVLGIFYAAKEATSMKDFTNGVDAATDHWGATGVAAMMDAFTPPFKSGFAYSIRYGSGTNQVLSEALSGAGWVLTGLGFPRDGSGVDATGTNLFGKDYFYQYIRNDVCLLSSAYWGNSSYAGVWFANWDRYRTCSNSHVGFRLACYPD
jgi:hypothetical protein